MMYDIKMFREDYTNITECVITQYRSDTNIKLFFGPLSIGLNELLLSGCELQYSFKIYGDYYIDGRWLTCEKLNNNPVTLRDFILLHEYVKSWSTVKNNLYLVERNKKKRYSLGRYKPYDVLKTDDLGNLIKHNTKNYLLRDSSVVERPVNHLDELMKIYPKQKTKFDIGNMSVEEYVKQQLKIMRKTA